MNEKEVVIDENAETGEEKIPVNDKRRFNADGERVADDPAPAEPVISAREIVLEASLKAETERREAAETKLVGVQAKFEEAKANLERETAEMRARLMKTLEDRGKQAQFNFLTTLLPVLDNLNLAVAASETDPSVEHLRNGVVGTARSFEQALISVGVEPIASIGTDFDPELHEAVDMAPVDADSDGKITAEYARGYRFGDRLLRPARVQVGKVMAGTATE
ncbi:MAG: nucleotide exchange factor GrpE [Pyrinomonadaceae bacterium]|nr:nucleotide exchange factor GrpE [Pyrinomonadaceae bacterium]MBP6211883.1 nucleotide exchange factor GrpE [Pyrinomonadaceae bacterium]